MINSVEDGLKHYKIALDILSKMTNLSKATVFQDSIPDRMVQGCRLLQIALELTHEEVRREIKTATADKPPETALFIMEELLSEE